MSNVSKSLLNTFVRFVVSMMGEGRLRAFFTVRAVGCAGSEAERISFTVTLVSVVWPFTCERIISVKQLFSSKNALSA